MKSRCQAPFSASVVFACFRVTLTDHLGRSWLTSSPFVLGLAPDPRVFGFGLPHIRACMQVRPLVHFDATVASSPQARRPKIAWPSSTQVAWSQSSLPERLDPSAFPDERTLLFTPLSRSVHRGCLPRWKSRPQGLATLSTAFSPFHPRKPLSAPNTPGLRPPKLSSYPMVQSSVSTQSLRSDASPANLTGLLPAFQRLSPIR